MIQLRLDISLGCDAIGTSTSMNSGYFKPCAAALTALATVAASANAKRSFFIFPLPS
jgi:hypothetical protein